ncbi:WYL domain-containing protein [Laribacter hongkongensis]|uniref:helix-turn-helix transcriptional regulator n=1 Tax=Laribacter hongkongensis TaxID=168471 RepID=UPI001EFD4474|nr:WYL domain-containing protein [Laribacter hongkongensis]MCG9065155.1 WYL domain-containing protein [Laribacter hongkongensis]
MKKNDTLLRHWHMLHQVPRFPRRVSTAEILSRLEAAGFDATLRTIQRDLVKLSASLPLLADSSKPQGWSWAPDAPQLDLPTLEPQAALVFHLAERYLDTLLPKSTLDYLAPWFRTATKVLDNQSNGLSAWRRKVRVLAKGLPQQPPKIDPDVQSVVTQALLTNRQLEVVYCARGTGEPRQYQVNPLGLVVRDQVIYLVCTLRDYDDIRQLMLGRIHQAELINVPVREIEGFDLDDYIARGNFGFLVQAGKVIDLILLVEKDYATTFVERPLHPNQKVLPYSDKLVRLAAQVPDTQELRRWIMGFGVHAQVIAPASLREEMRLLAAQLQAMYMN